MNTSEADSDDVASPKTNTQLVSDFENSTSPVVKSRETSDNILSRPKSLPMGLCYSCGKNIKNPHDGVTCWMCEKHFHRFMCLDSTSFHPHDEESEEEEGLNLCKKCFSDQVSSDSDL